MTGDEALRRMHAALAEMGYDHVDLRYEGLDQFGQPDLSSPAGAVPDAIRWTAARTIGLKMPCWSCYMNPPLTLDCGLGDCGSPEGPARPPRELLVAAP